VTAPTDTMRRGVTHEDLGPRAALNLEDVDDKVTAPQSGVHSKLAATLLRHRRWGAVIDCLPRSQVPTSRQAQQTRGNTRSKPLQPWFLGAESLPFGRSAATATPCASSPAAARTISGRLSRRRYRERPSKMKVETNKTIGGAPLIKVRDLLRYMGAGAGGSGRVMTRKEIADRVGFDIACELVREGLLAVC
jgi:hypothetical protein